MIASAATRIYRGTLLLAIVVATALASIAELIGSPDYEGSFRFDSNWGARYQLRETFDGLSRRGIQDVLGVPVFDGAQGLGHRLPNFVTMPHSSPLILLSRWIPAHLLSLALVWLALVLCWSVFDIMSRSWGKTRRLSDRIWFTSFISSLTFVMLLYNDWSLSLVGMLGVLSFVVSLFDRRLWVNQAVRDQSPTVPVSLAIASILVMSAAHPTFWFVLPPVLPWVARALINGLRATRVRPSLMFASVVMCYIIVIYNFEYRRLGLPSSAVRDPLTNSFDFLKSSEGHANVLAQLGDLVVTNCSLPLLLVADRFGFELTSFHTRESFLNFGGLLFVLLIYAAFRTRDRSADLKIEVTRRLLASVASVIIWMSFGSSLQWLPTPLRLLFVADGWFYQFLGAGLIVAAALVITSPYGLLTQAARVSGTLTKSAAVAVGTLSIFIALLFPLALLRTAPARHWIEPRRDMFSNIMDSDPRSDLSLFHSGGGRLAEINPNRDRGFCTPGLLWKRSLDVSHPLVVARSGLPTVESSPGYRSSGVAVSRDADVLHCDSLLESGCNLRTFDFLSIGLVFSPLGHPKCEGFESVRTLDEKFKKSSVSDPDPPTFDYHNFYVLNGQLDNNSPSNCSLSSDCLDETILGTESTHSAPWQICDSDCWFRYTVLPNQNLQLNWLVLPARYDSASVVEIEKSETSLETSSYRGLLAVRVPQLTTAYSLIVRVDADVWLYLFALAPWLVLAAFVALSTELLRPAIVARTNHRQDP